MAILNFGRDWRRCLLAVTLLLGSGGAVSAEPVAQLNVLTWSEYIDPDVVAEFEAAHDVKLNLSYFETDETRDDILIAADGKGYDLILVNGLSSRIYHQRGWLAPISAADAPNLKHIDPYWLENPAGVPGYGVPYFWGTLGIAYRSDLVSQPITHWMQLFDPADELKGRIVMIKHSRDLIGMALMALGHSANSTDARELAEARTLLLKQKPSVKTYSYISLSEDSSLVKGEVLAAQMYSGDALYLREILPDIEYVIPEDGTNLWIDYWALSAHSNSKDLAFAFLDFINEPKIAARLADYLQYPTPNLAAKKLLPPEHLDDPLINPGPDVLKRGEYYDVLPPRTMRTWNSIFADIVN